MLECISDLSKYRQNSYYLTITHPEEYGLSHKKIFEIAFTRFSSCIYVAVSDEIGKEFHTHILLVFCTHVDYQNIHQYFKHARIEYIWENIELIISHMSDSKLSGNIYERKIEHSFEERISNYPISTKGVCIYDS